MSIGGYPQRRAEEEEERAMSVYSEAQVREIIRHRDQNEQAMLMQQRERFAADAEVARLRDQVAKFEGCHIAGGAAEINQALEAAWNNATAAQVERDRWKMKAEQYQQQLDGKWEGVVAVVNKSNDENGRLRDQVTRLRDYVAELVSDADKLPFANVVLSQFGKAQLERARTLLAEPAPEGQRVRGTITVPIVVMCGSVRFRSTWIEEYGRLTDEGNIVLSVGRMLPKAEGSFDPAHKARLDELHKRKIDLADWVWVLDVGGYVGESTRSEIAYATALGRPIRYLSKKYPDYVEPPEGQRAGAEWRAIAERCANLLWHVYQNEGRIGEIGPEIRAAVEAARQEGRG